MHVGAAIEQQLHDVGMALRRPPTSAPSVAARVSAALTLAFRASSARTAATLPVRAASINGVTPVSDAAFGLAPFSSRRSTIAALPLSAASASGVIARSLAASTRGAGGDQQLEDLDIAVVRGPVQRGGAVAFGGIDVDALLQQRPHRGRIVAFGRLHERLIATTPRREVRVAGTPAPAAITPVNNEQRQCANRC